MGTKKQNTTRQQQPQLSGPLLVREAEPGIEWQRLSPNRAGFVCRLLLLGQKLPRIGSSQVACETSHFRLPGSRHAFNAGMPDERLGAQNS